MGRIRFANFDFDPPSRELRREGVAVHLQAQPAQVLALLLEHASEVVTRETFHHALWGADTFVDFDRGLNFCIAQIRAALDDSAESPRFIRTLPKRGYQFIAPVTSAAPVRRKPVLLALLSIAAAVALVMLAWSAIARQSPPDLRVAITPFDNETSDPALDRFAGALTDALTVELTTSASGRFGVIGNAAILRYPRAQRDLLAIGSSLQARYVILGQVQQNASHIRVLAHLIRLPDQTHVWVTRFDHLTLEDPLKTEQETAQRIAAEFTVRIQPVK